MTAATTAAEADTGSLRDAAVDWCFLHGLVVRPPPSPASPPPSSTAAFPSLATHAPFALLPTPVPRTCFRRAERLQPLFNHMVHTVAQDEAFVRRVMDSLSQVDSFTGSCYEIYKSVMAEGITQRIVLGLHRSDYLLHDGGDGHLQIQQVELNTISASFASLSAKVSDLHRHLAALRPDIFRGRLPASFAAAESLVENRSLEALPKGIAAAHALYGSPNAIVVMVVQPGERNRFDQRWIDMVLLEKYGVNVIRKSLAELNNEARLVGDLRKLFIGTREVSVVYYRAGYTPDDYPGKAEWAARLLVERSHAVKCPNVTYHLVGAKKVQQILAEPGMLEKFVGEADARELRTCFTGLYPLDESPAGLAAYEMALRSPDRFVLKPQREGGGNNFYGADVRTQLMRVPAKERNAYILMDLIRPPPARNLLVRSGAVVEADVISELGIYGVWLSEGSVVHLNEAGGHLLRTKTASSHEGGVAAGFAVLDSPAL
ncbi:hypothetical protein HK405_010136, partial [Cladochytrium tenue]